MKHLQKNTGDGVVTLRRMLTAGLVCLLAAGAVAFLSGGSHAGWDRGSGNGSTASNSSIAAAIEPENIALGEAAILVVQVSGEDAGPPALSPVEGLRFYSMGRSSQYQSINGRVSATTSYLFQVQAEHTGDFVIPPAEAQIDGKTRKSEPVTLRVAQGASRRSGRNALPSSPPQSQSRALSQRGADIKRGRLMSWEEGKPAFLRVLPRADRAYVGELLPIEIKAYFHQGVQATLRTLPVIQGDAFACRELKNKPEQTEEIMNGVPYHVLTWYTAISAVKEGQHPVSAELDATLGIPEQSRRRSPFGRGFFDDDFFSGFFQNIREEPVTLANPRLKIRVLPLPKMGRPEDFSGAVGRFELSATATPQKSMVGDPITVKMNIRGTGNFDRVSTPLLHVGKEWKTYRPSASFKAASGAGYRGEKSFEQAVIPMDGSIKAVPPVTFVYFDTEKDKYVTLKTKAIPLTLALGNPSPSVSANEKGSGNQPDETPRTGISPSDNNGLAPIHVAMESTVKTLRPLVENPWFLGAQGFPVGAIFLGFFFSRRQKRRFNDPGLVRKKQVRQNVGRSIREMDRAIISHDVTAFFHACRTASQERLGEMWGQTPCSITLAEIKDRLGGGAPGIAKVFEKADAATYSGQTFCQEELQQLRDLVVSELKDLSQVRQATRH